MKVKSVLSWCRRYIRISFVLMVVILTYIMFFSENSVMDNYRYQKEIDELKSEIALNYDTLQYYQKQLNMLSTDPAMMERVAREKYHMQRENEDVFISN